MKVGIIGASGMAGSAIYKLASENKDLEVTGIVRDKEKAERVLGKDAHLLIGDVLTMDDSLLENFDVIVDAFGTTPEKAKDQVKLATKLCGLAKNKDIRVIFILGAGSLRTGIDNHLVVEDIKKLTGSENWINTPQEQLNELNYLKQVEDVDWLGISPALTFEAGPEGAGYMLGNNTLLFNNNNESKVTSGTMARLIVNEIVHPKHHKERITLVDE